MPDANVLSQNRHHSRNMRPHFWRLSDDGGIKTDACQLQLIQLRNNVPEQGSTIDPGISRVSIWKMAAYIAKACCAQQSIADGMQQDITIGMRFESFVMSDANTTEHQVIAFLEGVNIVALPNAHQLADTALQKSLDEGQVHGASNLGIEIKCFHQ